MNAPWNQPPSGTATPVTFWLAAGLIALPFLQALPIDFDRSAPLIVLLPALWSGRSAFRAAVSGLARSNVWVRSALSLMGGAILLSLFFSDQPAPATVGAASWVLLATAGVIAGGVVQADARASRQLLAGLALGTALGAAVMWFLWLAGGRGSVPLYAHHRILGLHMLVGAMATTALVVHSHTASQRWRWLAVGAINWGALLWSGGRGPLVAVAGGLGCWFLARSIDRKSLAKAGALQLLAGLALSAAFWTPRPELGWWHAFARTTAAATPAGNVDISVLTSTRSDFWRESAQRALRSPWVGHGPDAYRFLTPKLDGQQPHNVVLQLWLDLGLLGALPALALLVGSVLFGWQCARRGDTGAWLSPWVALLTALILAGLLDGVFYHVLTLLPVMLAFGVVLFAISVGDLIRTAGPDRSSAYLAVTVAGAAIAVLALHAFLFHALVVARPPAGPEATVARLVRAFPSTTFGLWTWLDQWHRSNPDAALAWARWAQLHATNPSIFHIRAAQYLQIRGDRAAALEEMSLAEAKAHRLARPAITELKGKMFPTP